MADTRNTEPTPQNPAPRYARLTVGDPAPTFLCATEQNPRFAFDTMAGRYVVLCFMSSAASPEGQRALDVMRAHRALFDDDRISFFGLSCDPADVDAGRIRNRVPGVRFFRDFDYAVSRLYGALPAGADEFSEAAFRPFWLVLDPALRVMARFDCTGEAETHQAVIAYLQDLPPPMQHAGFDLPPPVIILPRVFEPDFCRQLIDLYDAHGGAESGFMREIDGKTVGIHDYSHKRRRDYDLTDQTLIHGIQRIFMRRIFPEIMRVHHFRYTRMERYIVGCYDAEDGGHFRAHRDNTTKGTAHRKFAVSINLNADFEGGEISFPEYSRRSFKAPVGGAVIFSGSLLHAVSKVTAGRRYAFLPFLYDDAAARLRAENSKFLVDGRSENRLDAAAS